MPPANDNLADAQRIFSAGTLSIDTTGATDEPEEVTELGYLPDFGSVWYVLTAAEDGTLTVDTSVVNPAHRPYLALFTGPPAAGYADLVPHPAVNLDDFHGNATSNPPATTWALTAGTSYYIYASSFDLSAGPEIQFTAAFTSTVPAGRVCIAFDDGPLVESPTWTRIDDTPSLVAQIRIRMGREHEFDETNAGTATVFLHDTTGDYDPNNASSPYFGKLDGKQIQLMLYNPVDGAWYSRFRGIIDNYGHDLHPAINANGEPLVSNVQIECVGIFDFLAGVDLLPGVHGDVPPAGSEGTVFYEDGEVNDRITQILVDVGVGVSRYVVFSGNVNVQETKYDPGDKALVALRDAADAEFPGLANIYEDRFGRFVFHGRGAKIDPEGVIAAGPVGSETWDFQRYKVGDGAAIAGDSQFAQVRPPLAFSRSRNRVINAALIWPMGVAEADIPGLVYSDATSITAYGVHSVSWTELILSGHKTNGDTAEQQCLKMAEFWVENFKTPRNRVEALTVKALRPSDPRASATWEVLCRSDISDVVRLKVGYPGGTGIDEDLFIEGWEQTIRPGGPDFDFVDLSLNVSPTAYYSNDVFGDGGT